MTLPRYCVGVHGYEPNNALVNVYTAGELQTYLTALGLGSDAGGALAHEKLKDTTERWRAGTVPATWGTDGHDYLFIQEAKALGFKTVAAWVPEGAWNYYEDAGEMAQFDLAAAACVSTYPDVDVWLFGNERESKDFDADVDETDAWFTLENRAGQIWQGLGKEWMAGADQAPANFLSTLKERMDDYWATDPDWLALHHYGSGGFTARQVGDLRRSIEYISGKTWDIAFTEWALDFENLTGYGTKAWVRDYRSREFNEHIARALRRERVYGCFFNFKEIAQESPDFFPRLGILQGMSNTQTDAEPPSPEATTAGLVVRRYLLEGRYWRNAIGATWQGLIERRQRSVGADEYWADR